MTETALYAPVKRFLEDLGYDVKGEIGSCDIVALREAEPPLLVIAELKQAFNLELVLQAVDRLPACDEIWVAVRASTHGRGRERDPRVIKLCRRLGLGLLVVSAAGTVAALAEPALWQPRANLKRRSRLLTEHRRRVGDPTAGGSTRSPIMTAYRQRALACAAALASGPGRPRDLKPLAADAAGILQHNVYGWFERVTRGLYGLTETGRLALQHWQPPAPPDQARMRDSSSAA